jgi:hypothetical protein
MWKPVEICAAGVIPLMIACCASPPPPTPQDEEPGATPTTITVVDSLDVTAYDFLFTQLHADMLDEIERMEEQGQSGARLIEVRTILRAAEQIYLEGGYVIAIELLAEADEILRNTP